MQQMAIFFSNGNKTIVILNMIIIYLFDHHSSLLITFLVPRRMVYIIYTA